MKQNLSAASGVARALTADDAKSVKSIKSSKSIGDQSAGDESLDTTCSILTVKRVDTTETPKTTKSFDTTESVGTTVVSHEDDDQSLVSNASTFVYRATVVDAFDPRNWLQLFSREDEGETVDGSEAESIGESFDSFTSEAEDNELYVSDEDSSYADTISVTSRDTRYTASRSKRTRNKMFQRFLSASS